jgi:DnaJ homolog subfamily B member 4
MFDDGNDMSDFAGMGGMPGGFGQRFQQAQSTSHPARPTEITKPLPISLEDLYTGTTKRLQVSRKLLDGTKQDKVLHSPERFILVSTY